MVKQLLLFLRLDGKKLKRNWHRLPLLFLFPFLLILLSAILVGFLIFPSIKDPIHVGLIDHDRTPETRGIVQLFEQSQEMTKFIQINEMSETEAQTNLEKDRIAAYIKLPDSFTKNLYEGTPTTLPVIGNPNRPIESHLVYEMMETISRHIRSSQANILTIHHYAKELGKEEEELNDILFQQFTDFVFYTLSSGHAVHERSVNNEATSSPVLYFSIGSLFIIFTGWLWMIYLFLYRDTDEALIQRMKLYGVTKLRFIISKILWAITISSISIMFLYFLVDRLLNVQLQIVDYIRLFSILILYGLLFLYCLAIIEMLFSAQRIQLLLQFLLFTIICLLSGAIIPTIYFPLWLENIANYLFSYEGFYWIREIMLNHRQYTGYLPLFLMVLVANLILFSLSSWKERRN